MASSTPRECGYQWDNLREFDDAGRPKLHRCRVVVDPQLDPVRAHPAGEHVCGGDKATTDVRHLEAPRPVGRKR